MSLESAAPKMLEALKQLKEERYRLERCRLDGCLVCARGDKIIELANDAIAEAERP
ncbi:MAG TPA: hypothetical protein VKA83_25875 [Methylomirabilota bacterium]|nr:hypothetical protein [Methylomirabilota bacterium]